MSDNDRQKRMSIICWSGDLDRVWPVLILSTTAAVWSTGAAPIT